MFDFFFKRKPKASASAQTSNSAANIASLAAAHSAKVDQQQQVAQIRAATLAKIESQSGDEEAIIGLLLACDFADGRFKAAQFVHSSAGLKKVLNAMRNTDKRVAKLMQSRIDAIAQAEQQLQLAQRCIDQARQLGAEASLIPQQIADLDKLLAGVKHFPDHLKSEFDRHYHELQARLLAQTSLQRRVLDLIQQLIMSQGVSDDDHGSQLDQWQQEFDQCRQQAEAAALPRHLLLDFSQKMQAAREQWVRLQQQKPDDIKVLVNIEADVVDDTKLAADLTSDIEVKEGSDPIANIDADTSVSKTEIVAKNSSSTKAKQLAVKQLSAEQIMTALHDMEAALEQGSALLAQKIERELLRGVDIKQMVLSSDVKERLFKVQAELGRLLSWAKWGGSISRDELIKTAEELPTQELEANELARKVGSLRERWKSLEASTGGAAKDIWERFDAACNIAYAPAAAYFQQLAEERKVNLEKAELQLNEWRIKAGEYLQATPDWKSISQFIIQMKQAWQTLGVVDRKNKARVDGLFYTIYHSLSQPLEQQRKAEITSREQLISQVAALDPKQRDAVDQLRALQTRWQEQAQALPLRRKDEQALWDQFRAACDGLFAQRKAVSENADAERKANLQAKEALCDRLEQAASEFASLNPTCEASESTIKHLLQEVGSQWRSIGYVPRGEESAIERRFEIAGKRLRQLLQHLQDEKNQAGKKLLLAKLSLCQQLEAAFVQDPVEATTLIAQLTSAWQQFPVQTTLPSKVNAGLNQRFSDIRQAVEAANVGYVDLLRKNADIAAQSILQLEILNSIDSPAELARARLQIQVEVLKTALRSGNNAAASIEQLYQLCVLPAVLDVTQQQRLNQLVSVSSV